MHFVECLYKLIYFLVPLRNWYLCGIVPLFFAKDLSIDWFRQHCRKRTCFLQSAVTLFSHDILKTFEKRHFSYRPLNILKSQ